METRQQAPTQKSGLFRKKTGTAASEDERSEFILFLFLVSLERLHSVLNCPSAIHTKPKSRLVYAAPKHNPKVAYVNPPLQTDVASDLEDTKRTKKESNGFDLCNLLPSNIRAIEVSDYAFRIAVTIARNRGK